MPERERFDVLCGYMLGVLVSGLRGVRATLRRLVTEDDDDTRTMRPPNSGAPVARGRGNAAEVIRGALAATPPLPAAYGDDRLILVARDPWTLAASWDLAPTAALAEDDRLVLRVYDLTLLGFDDGRPCQQRDHEVRGAAGSYFASLAQPGGAYRAEIGVRRGDGTIAIRARSSIVTVPRLDRPGHDPIRWMRVGGGESLASSPRLVQAPAGAPLDAPSSARIPWQLRATSSEEHQGRGG